MNTTLIVLIVIFIVVGICIIKFWLENNVGEKIRKWKEKRSNM